MKTVIVYKGDTALEYELANFGERLLARIIDVLIIFIPNSIIPILPSWLYWSLMQSGSKQSTVGQRAMNIMILDYHNYHMTFGRATGRFFANLLNVLTLGIGYLIFFTSDKNQALHDLICNTVVVKSKPINLNIELAGPEEAEPFFENEGEY